MFLSYPLLYVYSVRLVSTVEWFGWWWCLCRRDGGTTWSAVIWSTIGRRTVLLMWLTQTLHWVSHDRSWWLSRAPSRTTDSCPSDDGSSPASDLSPSTSDLWPDPRLGHCLQWSDEGRQSSSLTNQRSAFSATCSTDRAGCYSDLGCATCCAIQQQPITDVQQKSRSKVAQQKSATKVYVRHRGKLHGG